MQSYIRLNALLSHSRIQVMWSGQIKRVRSVVSSHSVFFTLIFLTLKKDGFGICNRKNNVLTKRRKNIYRKLNEWKKLIAKIGKTWITNLKRMNQLRWMAEKNICNWIYWYEYYRCQYIYTNLYVYIEYMHIVHIYVEKPP